MPAGITTSIRMPQEIRDLYDTLAQTTGRARNDLMVEVLRAEGERRINEIALILEGREQARAGKLRPLSEVIERFQAKGMLSPEFELGDTGTEPTHG